MDADKLNRELQIFRNHVKIARENIIHKLVRDIKFWKAKQEANVENKRAAKKVESLETLIRHIKSQPASELAKAVIRFNPKTFAGTVGLQERALYRFHENKKLQPEVKALIRRFGLKDKMEVLDKYLKNRGEGRKATTGNKTEKKKEKPKKIKKSKEKKNEQESEDQGFCEESNDPCESLESDSSSEIGDIEEEQDAGKFVKLVPVKEKTEKKTSVLRIKENKPKKSKDFKLPEEDDTENKCVQVQDSFFVTSSGQTYVATAPVVDKKQQEQDDEDQFSWKRSHKRKDILGNKEDMPLKRPYRGDKEGVEATGDSHLHRKSNQLQKGIQKFQGQRKRLNEDSQESADLHPSWAAKQKQRNIQPFVGKKITFDGGEEVTKPVGEDLHPSWAAKQRQRSLKPFAGKKIVFDAADRAEPKQPSAENLHPSWAAKQQQKGLKPFQGKKIVFETETDRSVETKVPTDLHPSWAAKQKEKGIQEFRGKKITFDD